MARYPFLPLALKAQAGPLLMGVAALLFTLMSVIVKVLPEGYTIWHIGFIRCFGGTLVLVSISPKGKNPFAGHNVPLLMFRGLTGSLAFVSAVGALRMLPISTATVLFYAYPVCAAAFGFIIYKETVTGFQLTCMAILVAGVAILFDFGFGGNALGQALAVLGSVFAGLTVTLIRSLRAHNGPIIIYLYFCIMGTVFNLPYCLTHPLIPATGTEWLLCFGLVFVSVCAQLCMNQGFFYCKGFEGASYMSCEAVFTAVVGVFFFNDPISFRFFAGALLIVGSGLALNWVSAKQS